MHGGDYSWQWIVSFCFPKDPISANAKDELEKNTEAMEELEKLGQDVK